MNAAQDYLDPYVGGHVRGGFNTRLHDGTREENLHMIHQGPIWADRNAGWECADKLIKEGKIFSITKIDGKEIEFKCYQDGNAWCCVGPEFKDLQASDCFAFGDTREEAIKAFAKKQR